MFSWDSQNQRNDTYYLNATFDPEDDAVDEIVGVLIKKGVPDGAIDHWIAENTNFENDGLQVNCSSKEKAENVKEMVEDNADPVHIKISSPKYESKWR